MIGDLAQGAVQVLMALGAALIAVFSAYFFGQRRGRKDQSNEMRVRDYENADAVRDRADAVRVSEDDIKFRD